MSDQSEQRAREILEHWNGSIGRSTMIHVRELEPVIAAALREARAEGEQAGYTRGIQLDRAAWDQLRAQLAAAQAEAARLRALLYLPWLTTPERDELLGFYEPLLAALEAAEREREEQRERAEGLREECVVYLEKLAQRTDQRDRWKVEVNSLRDAEKGLIELLLAWRAVGAALGVDDPEAALAQVQELQGKAARPKRIHENGTIGEINLEQWPGGPA